VPPTAEVVHLQDLPGPVQKVHGLVGNAARSYLVPVENPSLPAPSQPAAQSAHSAESGRLVRLTGMAQGMINAVEGIQKIADLEEGHPDGGGANTELSCNQLSYLEDLISKLDQKVQATVPQAEAQMGSGQESSLEAFDERIRHSTLRLEMTELEQQKLLLQEEIQRLQGLKQQ
ncbi:unnamed protein product, partial [Polarella glacialis]